MQAGVRAPDWGRPDLAEPHTQDANPQRDGCEQGLQETRTTRRAAVSGSDESVLFIHQVGF